MMGFPLLALAAAVQGAPGGLRWPLGPGDEAYPLRATYGQLEGDHVSWDLHMGLDVLTRSIPEPVHAIEDGVVIRLRRRGGEMNAVLVESASVPGRAILYLHLDKQFPVAVGDTVEAGTPLGWVRPTNSATGEPHLHLVCLGGSYRKHTWKGLSDLSTRDPLRLLAHAPDADPSAPKVVPFTGGLRVALRPDDGLGIAATEEPPGDPATPGSGGTGEWLDVVVKAYDTDTASTHCLAPSRLSLTIQSGSERTAFRPIRLDVPLVKQANKGLYDGLEGPGSPFPSRGWTPTQDYDYFFVLTNGGWPGGTQAAWLATPGTHVLHVEIEDARGNVHAFDETLVIP